MLLRPSPIATPSRRRFVQGLAMVGGAAALGAPGWTRAQTQTDPAILTGDTFNLSIGEQPFNVTGKNRIATSVNNSVPAPTLRFREGDEVTINVTNHLKEPTSLHWHGMLLPSAMDGVPGLSFVGIMPGETFTYRFPIKQSGTYWYHSHSGMQEQTGMYGALILDPKVRESYAYDREHVILLSDWTDEDPMTVLGNLKQQGNYYNLKNRTLGDFFKDARRKGFKAARSEWGMWGQMRMSPTDIMDVTGMTYTFLMNGQPPAANWTALCNPGERVRLRFINGSAMTTFDVRIPGLKMTVVAADGGDVHPVEIDEFRIGVAETYDMIVQPAGDRAYTIFAQAQDRTGYARGTLAFRAGETAEVPPMDKRPVRTMADMSMGSMAPDPVPAPPPAPTGPVDAERMLDQLATDGSSLGRLTQPPAAGPDAPVMNATGVERADMQGKPDVDNVAAAPRSRLHEAGTGLDRNGRKVLRYSNLRALYPDLDTRPPEREIEFELTGNMERWTWGFDGKKFSEAPPVRVKLGERVRFTLVNNTMMEHPIHLHGFFFTLENGQDGALPLKHTVNVKPAEKLSFVYTAHTPGHWAFHCHLMFHMESGMFRTVIVS